MTTFVKSEIHSPMFSNKFCNICVGLMTTLMKSEKGSINFLTLAFSTLYTYVFNNHNYIIMHNGKMSSAKTSFVCFDSEPILLEVVMF